MNAATQRKIEKALGAKVVGRTKASGGNINEAEQWLLGDDRQVFVKTNAQFDALPGLFAAEAAGLRGLRSVAGSLGVPEVIAVGEGYLVLELIPRGGKADDFEDKLGRGLAELHRNSQWADGFGLERDNYLGRLPQGNAVMDDAAAFWRERRLLPLLERLTTYPEVVKEGRCLADRLDKLLAMPSEPAVLIHGDLWSGNACADRDGRVWIFDPACVYACREVEFGMTRLFGFGTRFERAYQEVWPLADGWECRVEVYRLHHLLSHLWHFGGGYLDACHTALRRLV